jgi:D-arabinose 1-dehydrogenase-like Zn-dependent alcohol dehydrogenase
VAVPVRNLIELPATIDDATAAVATDAVSNAYHAVVNRGALRAGMRVAIWGAGGLGTSAVAIARLIGARTIVVTDPRAASRARALEAGADVAVAPQDTRDTIAQMGGVDLALEFVGRSKSTESAVRSLDDGGRAVIVGLGAEALDVGSIMSLVLREREIIGSYGSEPGEVRRVIAMLATGELVIPHLVGEEIGLADVVRGVERVAAGDTQGRLVVAIA